MARRAAVRAERERTKELAAMAKAAEDAAKAIDGGEGAYRCASVAEVMAIRRVRDTLAAEMAVAAERLTPSAAAAITMVAPTAIPAHVDGAFVAVEGGMEGVQVGTARRVRKDRDLLRFRSPGSRLALVFELT